MKKNDLARLILLFVSLYVPLAPPVALVEAHSAQKMDPALMAFLPHLAPDQPVSIIVHMAGRPPASRTEPDLRRYAEASQASLRDWLRSVEQTGRVQEVTPFWIFNGLTLAARRDVILTLAQRPDVARLELDRVVLASTSVHLASDSAPVEPNLMTLGAPAAWAHGFTGKDVVVALLDSGVDMTHPDLAARWRGGSNSWFDPYGEHPDQPFDVNGHGTQMLGVILGGDAGGSRIGVAPDAQWIAAKIFNDRGRATVAGIHQALQWVLDPDGDPTTLDAPQVVNNSWSFVNSGCDLEFADDLRALRAAGLLPVFAAGVLDPVSPSNLPEAFAVGALAADGETLHADSARGPSTCGGETASYPDIVAPGAEIRTTDRFGTYATFDGSSLAAAHVSGALALLLSADPTLSADEQEALLTQTAADLGAPGPDNLFGSGRVDVAAAVERVLASHSRAAGGWVAIELAGVIAIMLMGVVLVVRWRRVGRTSD